MAVRTQLPSTMGRAQPGVRATFGPLLRRYFRMEVHGAENLPRQGAVVLAAKHASMWDVPLLVVAAPRAITFMAKEEVFGTPFKRWFFTELGGFAIDTGRGAIRSALTVLRSDRVLGIFPEGTRHREGLGPFRFGAAWMALATGAPLVPVGISGTERIWPLGSFGPRPVQVRITFGAPIRIERQPDTLARKQQTPELLEELRGRMQELL